MIELRFAGTVSKQGEQVHVIIPKPHHEKVEKLLKKQAIITIKIEEI